MRFPFTRLSYSLCTMRRWAGAQSSASQWCNLRWRHLAVQQRAVAHYAALPVNDRFPCDGAALAFEAHSPLAGEALDAVLSLIFKALWTIPIYLLSFVLNTIWYQDIADQACTTHGSSSSTNTRGHGARLRVPDARSLGAPGAKPSVTYPLGTLSGYSGAIATLALLRLSHI